MTGLISYLDGFQNPGNVLVGMALHRFIPGSRILVDQTSYQEQPSARAHTEHELRFLLWLQDLKYPDRFLRALPMAYNEAIDEMRMEKECNDSFQLTPHL